jgi:photosystem II stability/assembly factor-like uncharacterized protein
MLYGAAALDEKIVAVGDEGGVFASADDGRSWKQIKIRVVDEQSLKPAFYRAALSKDLLLVGGRNSLWRCAGDRWGEVTGLEAHQTVFALYANREGEEAFAAGGADAGGNPFILHSADAGRTWRYEMIDPRAKGRITAIARSSRGIFAATADGRILFRSSPQTAVN